jgi:hypothetical protein
MAFQPNETPARRQAPSFKRKGIAAHVVPHSPGKSEVICMLHSDELGKIEWRAIIHVLSGSIQVACLNEPHICLLKTFSDATLAKKAIYI